MVQPVISRQMANGPELKKYISTMIPSYSLTVKKYENIFRSEKKFWKKFHTIEIYSHRSGKRERTIFFIERMLSAS